MMLAGATAVQVGAANLRRPLRLPEYHRGTCPQAMEQYGINNLNDIIGGAHHG